ncbi:MAG: hypothetical protein ACOY0S_02375 [Patescibacteria group bacterium]
MKDYFQQRYTKAKEDTLRRLNNIWLVSVDLGYKVFDFHFRDFPDRCINTGAAECSAMGIAVGLALEHKIPIVYSITPFLLYRPFETIRNYIDRENIPVKMIGSGRDRDYIHDGFSHWAEENGEVMKIFKNIEARWPETKEEIPGLVDWMIKNGKPTYINLRR